ncbi:hypothetical protein GCM10011608_43730 [Micromonospora sonchi]|uniref:Uncharacterized protein n=1 Tax=Micromonospora sonchi TaxID=1763543 RepID=A0A917U3F5_9ACTN|nr:hypothetical protein GCM10011608_43730 [Micromonospora sonchi]
MGEACAGFGEAVVDLGGHGRVHGPKDEAVSFQAAHREGQHALGDPVDGALELAEAPRPIGEFDDHENRPLVAHPVKNVSDAAVGVMRLSAWFEFGGSSGYISVR